MARIAQDDARGVRWEQVDAALGKRVHQLYDVVVVDQCVSELDEGPEDLLLVHHGSFLVMSTIHHGSRPGES